MDELVVRKDCHCFDDLVIMSGDSFTFCGGRGLLLLSMTGNELPRRIADMITIELSA